MVRATGSVQGWHPSARPDRLSMPVATSRNAKGTIADHQLLSLSRVSRPNHPSRCNSRPLTSPSDFALVYDMPEAAKHAAVQEITQLLEGGS